jgi:hypothetical protein
MPIELSQELKSYMKPSDIITGQGQKVMKNAEVDTIASPNNSAPFNTSPEFKKLNGITDEQGIIDKEKEKRYLERRKMEITAPVVKPNTISPPIEVQPDEVFSNPLETIKNQKVIYE